MNIIQARVALRHRPYSDVLDLALRFIVVHWKLYAKVALVTLLPGILGTWLIVGPLDAGWIWGWVIAVTWTLFTQIPFTVLASRLVFEDTVRAREVMSQALREAPRVLVLRILTLTAKALGFLMLFVPMAWVAIIFCFSTEVLILERAKDPHTELKQLPFGLRGLSATTIEALDRRGLLEDLVAAQRVNLVVDDLQPERLKEPGGVALPLDLVELVIEPGDDPNVAGPRGDGRAAVGEEIEAAETHP